jgi:hypothetical protein
MARLIRNGFLVFSCLYTASFVLADLGGYTGQYGVGTIDLEIPVTRRNLSDITFKGNGQPVLEVRNSSVRRISTNLYRLKLFYSRSFIPLQKATTAPKSQNTPGFLVLFSLLRTGLQRILPAPIQAFPLASLA